MSGTLRSSHMEYRNDLLVWVYHLKRGGGHAIINYVEAQKGKKFTVEQADAIIECLNVALGLIDACVVSE